VKGWNGYPATRGRFISLEGIEGVGKSTQVDALCGHLRSRGIEVVATREPGGTPIGERIRGLLLATELPAMHASTELLLMYAARCEHLETVILPALARGAWVVSDRFHDASHAYQGGGRGLASDRIEALDDLVLAGRIPDLTLLLDAPVELALARAQARPGGSDRFEQERADFYTRVRARYLARLHAEPARIRRVDATGPVALVAAALAAILDEVLPR
jgi:dTMP kinase